MDYYNQDDLRKAFDGLAQAQLLAFVASCAERVLPFYQAYAMQEGRHDYDRLRRALDIIWMTFQESKPLQSLLQESRDHVATVFPDAEQVNRSPFSTNATDAVDILHNAYEIVLNFPSEVEAHVQYAVDSAIIARATIDIYLALVALPESDPFDFVAYRKLSSYDFTSMPMFLAEVQKQDADIALLKSIDIVDRVVVTRLRERGFTGVQPVKRLAL